MALGFQELSEAVNDRSSPIHRVAMLEATWRDMTRTDKFREGKIPGLQKLEWQYVVFSIRDSIFQNTSYIWKALWHSWPTCELPIVIQLVYMRTEYWTKQSKPECWINSPIQNFGLNSPINNWINSWTNSWINCPIQNIGLNSPIQNGFSYVPMLTVILHVHSIASEAVFIIRA